MICTYKGDDNMMQVDACIDREGGGPQSIVNVHE